MKRALGILGALLLLVALTTASVASKPTDNATDETPKEFRGLAQTVNDLKVQIGQGRRQATITIAFADSKNLSQQQCDILCDGIDDWEQIQAALDTLATLTPPGGSLYLAEGTCHLGSRWVTIPRQCPLRIWGPATILAEQPIGKMFYIEPAVPEGQSPKWGYPPFEGDLVEISGLTFTANNAGLINAIEIKRRHNIWIHHTFAYGNGMTVVYASYLNNSDVSHNIWARVLNGLWMTTDLDDNTITSNIIHYAFNEGMHLEVGNKLTVMGNTIEESEYYNLYLNRIDNSSFLGNTLTESYQRPSLRLYTHCDNNDFRNTIFDAGMHTLNVCAGIRVGGNCDWNTFIGGRSGNRHYPSQRWGIELQGGSRYNRVAEMNLSNNNEAPFLDSGDNYIGFILE